LTVPRPPVLRCWLTDDAQPENEDGFRAYIEPVNDPAFDGASWEAVKAAVPANENGAAVLFIADGKTLSSPDRPLVVVDLLDDGDKRSFPSIPSELWSIDNNLNIANMDWEDFAGAADEDGVFRGFDGYRNRELLIASSAHRHYARDLGASGRGTRRSWGDGRRCGMHGSSLLAGSGKGPIAACGGPAGEAE
jgi:hypothetical protein